MIDAKKLVKERTNFGEVEVVGQNMVCFSRCIIGKVIYMNPEVNKLKKDHSVVPMRNVNSKVNGSGCQDIVEHL